MNWLIDTLRSMAKKPAMYFGRNPATLEHLESFFLGIQVGAKSGDDLKVFDAFEEWVLWRHGVPELSSNSFGYVLHHACGDERKAFNLFFKFLEEYLVEREKIGAEGIKAGLKSFYDSKIPSIQDVKSAGFYEPYMKTLKKILAEFLGWSEAQTVSYVDQQLQDQGFRAGFGRNTPFGDAIFLLVPESIRNRLRGIALVRLHDRIYDALEAIGDTNYMFPDKDPRFDWQGAKRKVAEILKEYETSSEQRP